MNEPKEVCCSRCSLLRYRTAPSCQVISEIDVLVALAVCAHTWDWCRPTLLPVGSQVIKMKVGQTTRFCLHGREHLPRASRDDLDCLVLLLQATRSNAGYCRYPRYCPTIYCTASAQELRHPSVEASRGSSNFIPNDVELTHDGRLAIVTGEAWWRDPPGADVVLVCLDLAHVPGNTLDPAS